MQDNIRHLISNPNYLTSKQVRDTLVAKRFTTKSFEQVLGAEFVSNLRESSDVEIVLSDITELQLPDDYAEYTQVYVWGQEKSGKTWVLGSLFAAIESECHNVVWRDDYTTDNRRESLVNVFKGTDRVFYPISDQNTHDVQTYNVEFTVKGTLGSKKYCFTFIEVNIDNDRCWDTLEVYCDLLKSQNNKIHLLCFDSSLTKNEQQQQAKKLSKVLRKMNDKGMFATSVGLYLLVTKTDLMIRVPEQHRMEAAQTLITAGHRKLWLDVVNMCYKMNIYDATPIPFTVGDTVLKDLLKPDLSRAKALLHYPILLKAQPCLNFFERMLRKGNLAITIAVSIVVLAAMGYGVYALLEQIPTPPDREIRAYNFSDDFSSQVSKRIYQESNYSRLVENYKDLNWLLLAEQSIADIDGKALPDVDDNCRKFLDNAFGEKLNNEYERFFAKSNWSSQDGKIGSLKLYSGLLLKQNKMEYEVREKLYRNKDYFNERSEVKSLIWKSKHCTSWSDVEEVSDDYSSYIKYPFSNDEGLLSDLRAAKKHAYESYAQYLKEEAIRENYNYEMQKNRLTSGVLDRLINFSKLKDLRDNCLNRTNSLRNRRMEAMSKISYEDSNEARESLDEAIEKISF